MSEQLAVTLVPNSFDSRPKSFTMGQRLWERAVRMVDRTGFRPNVVGGLGKRDVPLFAGHLRRALATETVSDHDRQELDRLVEYLQSDGAARGLGLSRGFKRWDQS